MCILTHSVAFFFSMASKESAANKRPVDGGTEEVVGKTGAPAEKTNELTDEDLDALIDAMGKMKKPEGLDEKSFEEQLEVRLTCNNCGYKYHKTSGMYDVMPSRICMPVCLSRNILCFY